MNRTKIFLGALMGVTVLGAGLLMFKGTEQDEPDTATGVARGSAPVLKAVGSGPGRVANPLAASSATAADAPAGAGDSDVQPNGANSPASPAPQGEGSPAGAPAEDPSPESPGPDVPGPTGHGVSDPAAAGDASPETATPVQSPVAGETPAQGAPGNVDVTIDIEKCKAVKCAKPRLNLLDAPIGLCDIVRCIHLPEPVENQGAGDHNGPIQIAGRDDSLPKAVIKAPVLSGILFRH